MKLASWKVVVVIQPLNYKFNFVFLSKKETRIRNDNDYNNNNILSL